MTLNEILVGAQSLDPAIKLQAITQARRMLSSDRNPPIDELINAGILPILVSALRDTE
jgi:hypothetical protein